MAQQYPNRPAAFLDDIAEYGEKGWLLRWWWIPVGYGHYRKSTYGHYFADTWHPLAVEVRAYVVDDFGNLYLRYGTLPHVYDRHVHTGEVR